MNNIKTTFSIKDLENLSGIKAHTIRIWEKRYHLFSPTRTDTNIRIYSLESLQKLLNIKLLYDNGIKISKISKLTDDQIKLQSKGIISNKFVKKKFINDLKIAMLNFDQTHFEVTYQKLLDVIDFKEIFVSYFMPFLDELGLLWITNSINPAHEHFITSLIKQKILVNIEKIQSIPPTLNHNRFVLFLPENEIHDIGLSIINYEILLRGYSTIYLGPSVPISCLKTFLNKEEKITFITYFTVEPETAKLPEYLNKFHDEIITKCNGELWALGRKINELENIVIPSSVKLLTIQEMIETLDSYQLNH